MNMKHPIGELPLSLLDPIGIVNALAARKTKRRQQRLCRAAAIKQLRDHLLAYGKEEQLDLFQQAVGPVVAVSTQSFCRDVANTWTDQQIIALCDGIIKASLEGLKAFVNPKRRRELITWFSPSSDPDETLSFAFCCRVAGLDPEPITTMVKRLYWEEILGYLAADSGADCDVRQTGFAFAAA